MAQLYSNVRFKIDREPNMGHAGQLGFVTKNESDSFTILFDYSAIGHPGDYLTGLVGKAFLLSDRTTEKTTTVLASGTGTLYEGTAQAVGTTTTLKTDQNLKLAGWTLGDYIYNSTQKWDAYITSFTTTTVMYDTMNFDIRPTAVANADAWKSLLGSLKLTGGDDGVSYIIQAKATLASGVTLTDHVILTVKNALLA